MTYVYIFTEYYIYSTHMYHITSNQPFIYRILVVKITKINIYRPHPLHRSIFDFQTKADHNDWETTTTTTQSTPPTGTPHRHTETKRNKWQQTSKRQTTTKYYGVLLLHTAYFLSTDGWRNDLIYCKNYIVCKILCCFLFFSHVRGRRILNLFRHLCKS